MLDGDYIRTLDFTGLRYNFESLRALSDNCYGILRDIDKNIADKYVKMIWLDTVCFNMDRYTENSGLLRDNDSSAIVKLVPNFDNNIALISRGIPRMLKETVM